MSIRASGYLAAVLQPRIPTNRRKRCKSATVTTFRINYHYDFTHVQSFPYSVSKVWTSSGKHSGGQESSLANSTRLNPISPRSALAGSLSLRKTLAAALAFAFVASLAGAADARASKRTNAAGKRDAPNRQPFGEL